jgi:hypothetical protein
MQSAKLFLTHVFAVFCLLLTQQVSAQQWYHVELVVFEQLDAITDEQWPEMNDLEQATLNPEMANLLIQPAVNESLTQSASRLSRSQSYRVHYHKAWQQPVLSKRTAKPINIKSDNEMITGNIRLYKSTYLHAQLDLWLQQNVGLINSWSDNSPEGLTIEAPRNPNLKQSRRIRSKKIFFFDHPAFGALLHLTPITTPASAADEIQGSESYSLPSEASATESQ